MRNAARLLLILVLGAVPISQFPAFAQDALPGSTVIAVYDATAFSECQVEIQVDDGPWTPVFCPPGTLIQAEKMPLDEALARGYSYFPLTGEENLDMQLAVALMEQVHYAVAPPAPSLEHITQLAFSGGHSMAAASNLLQAFCNGTRYNVNGSYLVGPVTGTRYRAYWAIGYTVTTNCTLGSIRDRAKVGPSGYGEIRWQYSCAQGGSTCSSRNIVLIDEWTQVYAVASSAPYGSEYRNYGTFSDCWVCTSYYGWWTMEA